MITFDVSLSPSLLAHQLNEAIDLAFGKDGFETHGVTLKIFRRGDTFVNMDGSVVFCNVIADVEAFKKSGLFSSEIKGVIDINIAIQYDLSESFELTTKTDLVGHKWIEKPKLEIGILNMPVESLIELGINHYESIITAKVDATIKEKVELQKIIEEATAQIHHKLEVVTYKGVRLHLQPTKVILSRPKSKDNSIYIFGGLIFDSEVSREAELLDQVLTFEWLDGRLDANQITWTNFDLDEKFISDVLIQLLNDQEVGGKPLVCTAMTSQIVDGKFSADGKLVKPIKANIHISGLPSYEEEQSMLDMKDIDVKVNPEGLLYKLSAPVVNRFIEHKLDEELPINIKTIIKIQQQKHLPFELELDMGRVRVNLNEVVLKKISFEKHCLKGIVAIKGFHAEVTLG